MFPPLQHGLSLHLSRPQFTPSGQTVYVGTRSTGDGWFAAVIRIDDCANEAEASWLGTSVQTDLVAHLCFTNQEDVPDRAVAIEVGEPAGGCGWSVAVYVELASLDQAKAMRAFLTTYVDAGAVLNHK